MDRRSTTWDRWLGWTLVFALVVLASFLAYARVAAVLPESLDVVFFAPALVAAFLIGTRFRSASWVVGPLVVISTPVVVLILNEVLRGSSDNDVALAILISVGGAMLFGFVFALLAGAGVWWGRHRLSHSTARLCPDRQEME
jgi:hypothetical protein